MYLTIGTRTTFIPLGATALEISRAVRAMTAVCHGIYVDGCYVAYVAQTNDPRRG